MNRRRAHVALARCDLALACPLPPLHAPLVRLCLTVAARASALGFTLAQVRARLASSLAPPYAHGPALPLVPVLDSTARQHTSALPLAPNSPACGVHAHDWPPAPLELSLFQLSIRRQVSALQRLLARAVLARRPQLVPSTPRASLASILVGATRWIPLVAILL
jgi:hypothetical protein